VTAQVLDRTLHGYRIGDPNGRFPIFDATGSRLFPGRWNTPAAPVIYASEHYSTAMLEKLVHGSGRLPPNQHYVEIEIDAGLGYEVFSEAATPGWEAQDCRVASAFGDGWALEKRSVLLIVPSVVARMERNFLINPAHPDFGRIRTSLHQPVWWDARLFLPE
jgi:RES domain-containing protein